MSEDQELTDLETLLDRLGEIGKGKERISIDDMLDAVGERSFGALLIVPGLIALSPLSGVPGIPTTVSVMVVVIASQLLLRRRHFWLPGWLLRRSVTQPRFDRALRFLRPVARFIDRLIRPRLTVLTNRLGVHLVSVMAILVAVTMPPMELVPFAATAAGAALTAFGLALIAHDGVLLVVAAAFYGLSLKFVLSALFG